MDYNSKDLYKLSILELREIGRVLQIKGVTNKSKEDLIKAISNTDDGSAESPRSVLAKKLMSRDAINNYIPGLSYGYVLIEEDDPLCRMYDDHLEPLNISVPLALAQVVGVGDGDYIETRVSLFEGIKFASNILSINNGCNTLAHNKHVRELVLVPNVLRFLLDQYSADDNDINKKDICVLPLLALDESIRINGLNINCMSSLIDADTDKNFIFARLAITKLRRLAQKGKDIMAYVDLDRMLMSLEINYDYKRAIYELRKLFSSTVEYSNGGSIKILGATVSERIFDDLKSFALTYSKKST